MGSGAALASAVARARFLVAASAALLFLALPASAAFAAPPSLAALDPKVISYYPATGGWTAMWQNWDPARYRADLAEIAGLGATSVRIIVPATTFGFPEPAEPYVGRLRQLVGLAAGAGLTVQLTLFDWLGGSGYRDIAGSEEWARALLSPYAGDPRLAFVEVRNEIDPNDPDAIAWARDLIPFVRSLLSDAVPVTVSVGGADPVTSLRALKAGLAGAEPDFYTVHYYGGGGEQAHWTLQDAIRAVAPVPLWVGETGYPTSTQASGYFELPPTVPAQEAAQAHFLKTVAYAAEALGMPPPGIWTLDDFEPGTIPVDPSVQKEPEYDFGLFRTDGSAKPAAAAVRAIFGGTVPTDFDQGFELGVTTAAGGTTPADWSTVGSPNAELAQAHDRPHSGSADAVVRSVDGEPADGTFFVAPIESTPPPGTAGATASVWVRASCPTAAVRLELEWLDAGDAQITTRVSHQPALSDAWTELTLSGSPPPGARSLRILLPVTGCRGSVWFDDVSFQWTTAAAASLLRRGGSARRVAVSRGPA